MWDTYCQDVDVDEDEDQTDTHQTSGTVAHAHGEAVKHSAASNDELCAQDNRGAGAAVDSDGDASMSLSTGHDDEDAALPKQGRDTKSKRGNVFKNKLDMMQQSWKSELDKLEQEYALPADCLDGLSEDDPVRELEDSKFYKHFP